MAISLPPEQGGTGRGLPPARTLMGFGLILGVLVLLAVTMQWTGGPPYVTLYRNLEIGGVGAITDALTKGGIAYRLEAGGTELLVKPDDAARARVLLAKNDLPASGKPGMKLFDNNNMWSMTDFTQRVTFQRALEGELANTIGTLRGVEKAQVHLTISEQSALRRTATPSQAAVVVSVRAGSTLTPDVVQGIVSIVANSVPQLSSENVAITDDTGRLLSAPADAGGFAATTTRQMDLQSAVERQLATKAEQMLATVVGDQKARVSVAAQLNFEQAERTVEAFDPDKAVLQSEQKSETQADSAAGIGGQTIVSNTYQNSKTIERVIGSVGNVKKLTVAVLVDEAAIGKEATKVGATQQAQLALLETAVRNAIGIDSARGDRLTITAMPFEPVTTSALAPATDSTKGKRDTLLLVEQFSKPGLLLIGMIVALILGLRLLKPPPPPPPPPPAPGAIARGEPEGQGAGTPELADGGLPALPPQVASASAQLRKAVQGETQSQPEVVAQVVRTWLGETG